MLSVHILLPLYVLMGAWLIYKFSYIGVLLALALLLVGIRVWKKQIKRNCSQIQRGRRRYGQPLAPAALPEPENIPAPSITQAADPIEYPLRDATGLTLNDIDRPELQTIVSQSGPVPEPVRNADLSAEACSRRPYDAGDWTPNFYGPGDECMTDKWLETIGTQAYQGAAATAATSVLPESCSTAPQLCPADTLWQAKFKGCPSTWIETPTCKIYERDDRLWHKDLNPLIQERAMQNGEIWDFYKHFNARQLFSQFIAEDMVNRKDQYMRPISSMEESYCMGKEKAGIEMDNPEIPPICNRY